MRAEIDKKGELVIYCECYDLCSTCKNSRKCPLIQAIRQEIVANLGTPLKFIKGNGDYVGVFVITEIASVTEQATNEGDLISVQVDLKLREYTGVIPEDTQAEGGLKKK